MSLAAARADFDPISGRDLRSRGACERVQSLPRVRRRGSGHERLASGFREAQGVRVPGVELAQVAARALHPEMLLGAVDHPAQLVGDLGVSGIAVPEAEEALEAPGVAQ